MEEIENTWRLYRKSAKSVRNLKKKIKRNYIILRNEKYWKSFKEIEEI